jgi:hypothetical protein
VAAVNVGLRQFCGNPLLAGVDQLGLRPNALDAGDVLRLNRVTKNDSHAYIIESSWLDPNENLQRI